ncbi:MAG: septum formation protein Maf [Flavobacteriales bacterium]|nr:septum formation protein Maf [Flavobacteriales bacterium]
MFGKQKNYLLGSKSPRRSELLQMLGVSFSVVSINCDERFDPDMPPQQVAQYLAKTKSEAFAGNLENSVLITADTTVILKNEILNKPADTDEAFEMLCKLSGNQHIVNTGICLRNNEKTITFFDETEVFVNPMTRDEIWYYIEKYQPLDKAGAYGIQEWFGMAKIEKINGCFYNVMGLPTAKLYSELCKF